VNKKCIPVHNVGGKDLKV